MNLTHRNPRTSFRSGTTLVLLLAGGLLAGPASSQEAQGEEGEYQNLTVEELQEVVGPFALYPDELVRYILPACTHQEDMLAAAEILTRTNNNPAETDPEVEKLDDSVQALLPFPSVIQRFAEFPDWLGEVGDAVAFQQADVMDAIQEFRRRAYDAGNLKTTSQQTVIVEQKVIRIVQTDPEIIYVPVYQTSTVVVYQSSPVIVYGVGIGVGVWVWRGRHWGYWGGCRWDRKTTINVYGRSYNRPPGYRPGNHPGNRPGNRPGNPGTRPDPGPGNRPGNRPGASTRPSTGSAGSGARPSTSRPSTSRPSTSRPSTSRPSSSTTSTTRPSSSSGAFGGSSQGSSVRSASSRGATSRRTTGSSAGRGRSRGRRG